MTDPDALLARLEALNAREPADAAVADDAAMDAVVDGAVARLDEMRSRRASRSAPAEDDTAERCACGAPAALTVGYRGEPGPVLQCVRCATTDRRTPFMHRNLTGGAL